MDYTNSLFNKSVVICCIGVLCAILYFGTPSRRFPACQGPRYRTKERSLIRWETGNFRQKSSHFADFWRFCITFAVNKTKEGWKSYSTKHICKKCTAQGKRTRNTVISRKSYVNTSVWLIPMIDTPDVQGLLRYRSLNYEKLKGDKAGLSSVRVNDQYRIEFEERVKEGETIATICNITDLSNHYK